METASSFFSQLLNPTSIWSVVFRGLIWFLIAGVVIVSLDSPHPGRAMRIMKSNLGFTLAFILISTALVYLLFGITKQS